MAAISLLAGGIGTMNIMLVSVTERTPEIGIRMAAGARQSDILTQLLAEAMVVSAVGGLLGIAMGVGVGKRYYCQHNLVVVKQKVSGQSSRVGER